MVYRKVKIVENYYYHVYNRGNNFQNIFFEERNYLFFLKKLQDVALIKSREQSNNKDYDEIKKYGFKLVGYCLMPNHYHLIVHIQKNDFFENAMQRFSTSYTKAINKAYQRVGHLFQGRYKYKLVPENNYLLHLSRYIHLNPVRNSLVTKAEDWEFSSYKNYLSNKADNDFLDFDIVLNQVKFYKNFIEEFQESQSYFTKDLTFD
jgi:putative transposase